jgi:hypothetical protein
MAVTAPKEIWTDSRLDDFTENVDAGFAKVDADIREVRADMKAGFDKADKKMETGSPGLMPIFAN